MALTSPSHLSKAANPGFTILGVLSWLCCVRSAHLSTEPRSLDLATPGPLPRELAFVTGALREHSEHSRPFLR